MLSLIDFERQPAPKTPRQKQIFDLGRMKLLLDELSNPHYSPVTIHVAGTKGKGSTSAMISQILISQGYKVGLYSSPHLHSVRERIKVDSELISEQDFSDLVTEIYPYVDWVKDYGKFGAITTFEIITAMRDRKSTRLNSSHW